MAARKIELIIEDFGEEAGVKFNTEQEGNSISMVDMALIIVSLQANMLDADIEPEKIRAFFNQLLIDGEAKYEQGQIETYEEEESEG